MTPRQPNDGHVHEPSATGEPACVHCGKLPPKERRYVSFETARSLHWREGRPPADVVDIQTRRAGA